MDRNSYYDKLKGFAIFLVVIGHSIQWTYTEGFDSNEIFRLIYSFHMPLFMFISGLIAYKKGKKYSFSWVKKRFVSLVPPFIVWTLLPFLFSKDYKGGLLKFIAILKDPGSGYWFLWILFLNCVLLFCVFTATNEMLEKTGFLSKRKSLLFDCVVAVSCLILNALNIHYDEWGIKLLSWYCVFYFVGFLVGKHISRLQSYKSILGISAFVLWILLVPFWRRTEASTIFRLLPNFFASHEYLVNRIYNYFVGFAGTGMVLFFVYLFQSLKISVLFEKIGRRTIEIYLMHYFFLGIKSFDNIIFTVCFNIMLGIFLPYAISELFERNIERRLLFGKS